MTPSYQARDPAPTGSGAHGPPPTATPYPSEVGTPMTITLPLAVSWIASHHPPPNASR